MSDRDALAVEDVDHARNLLSVLLDREGHLACSYDSTGDCGCRHLPRLLRDHDAAVAEAERAEAQNHVPEDCADSRCGICIIASRYYQRGYDAGCDDPNSVWTSTIEAVRAEALREAARRYLPVAAAAVRGAYHDDPEVLSDRLIQIARRIKALVDEDRALSSQPAAARTEGYICRHGMTRAEHWCDDQADHTEGGDDS